MTDRYAVIGNPVAHSRSPRIHAEFAHQTGQDISYEAILAPLDGFDSAVTEFREQGGKGMNITLPFKGEAFHLAQGNVSVRALDAEAVNTFKFTDGEIFGDNTDGEGLMRDIERNLKFAIRGRRVLIMGAGGAAHGILHPLLGRGPAALIIANRTFDTGRRLAERGKKAFVSADIRAKDYAALAGMQFDLVINATSAGLEDDLPPLPKGIFGRDSLAYDMVYGKNTRFLQFAKSEGAAIVADGMGMLVEQAAESFWIWRGVRPETVPVIALLKSW